MDPSEPVTWAAAGTVTTVLSGLGVAAWNSRTVHVEPRQAIFTQGHPDDWLYVIGEGKVKIGCRAPDGRDHLLAIMGPAEVLGEESVLDPGPCTMTATALTHVRVVCITGDDVRAHIIHQPDVAEELMQTMARRLRRVNDHILDLTLADVAGRVATQLLALGGRFGVTDDHGAIHLQHDLTQSEIGQLIGAVRETVGKTLADFERRGWIHVKGQSVVILDPERLRQRTRTGLGATTTTYTSDIFELSAPTTKPWAAPRQHRQPHRTPNKPELPPQTDTHHVHDADRSHATTSNDHANHKPVDIPATIRIGTHHSPRPPTRLSNCDPWRGANVRTSRLQIPQTWGYRR